MRLFISIVVLAVLGVGLYVRIAPHNAERWHRTIVESSDADFQTGAVRVVDASSDTLARADRYIRTLPRTQVLAGSVEKGRVTYVTRSLLFGFPDYTTIEIVDGKLRAYARLRFGKSDMGVNRRRLEELLAALK